MLPAEASPTHPSLKAPPHQLPACLLSLHSSIAQGLETPAQGPKGQHNAHWKMATEIAEGPVTRL